MRDDLTCRELQILQQMDNPLRFPAADYIIMTHSERRHLKAMGMIEFISVGLGRPTRWHLTRAGELRAWEPAP